MTSFENKKKYLKPETVLKLNSMSLRARLIVEGYIIGHHRSPYHGFSVEFAEHKAYGVGDEVRHIDWKLYGKTDRLYVKRYQEETNLRANIILDTSKSMTYNSDKVSKLEYANLLTAALSYLMIHQQDATGLYMMGSYEQSQNDINEVLKFEKRHFGALSGQGLVQIKLKNYKKAIESYKEVEKIYPSMEAPKVMIPRLKKLIKENSI